MDNVSAIFFYCVSVDYFAELKLFLNTSLYKYLLLTDKEDRPRKEKSYSVRDDPKICSLGFHPEFDRKNVHMLLRGSNPALWSLDV
jgi:hypothetical protein